MNILGVLPHPDFGPWELGPLEIHSFGVTIAVGLLLVLIFSGRRGRRTMGVEEERVHNFAIWIVIFSWCFSHVFAVLFYSPDELLHDPLILFKVWGEISSVGGMLGGAIALLIWMKRNPNEDHLAWADVTMWALPIGFLFGRIGCTFAYDHPGQEAADFGLWNWVYEVSGGAVAEVFPLAMEFPERWGGGIRHNLGFYEAIIWAGIVVVFVILGRKPRRRGLYLWLLPLIYGPLRFFLDFLRAHPGEVSFGGDPRYLGLTPAQYTSLAFIALGIYGWTKLKDNPVQKWAIHGDSDEAKSENTKD